MRGHSLFPRALLLPAVGWGVCLAVVGCGPRTPPTGEVSGTVTYKGKPVSAGIVKFFPEAGGEPVSAPLGTDGNYRATGVPVGPAKVAVETQAFKHMAPPPPAIAKQISAGRPVYVPIPDKYERPGSSGLQRDVKQGAEKWDIDLSD